MDLSLLLNQTLPGLGFELVDVERVPRGRIRVFIDKPAGVTIDDCAMVSQHLSRLFVVENIQYEHLEVSSPGLDRVLKTEADFLRFVGQRVIIKTRQPIEKQKKFIGRLIGIDAAVVQLMVDNECKLTVPLDNIERARLKPEF